MNDSLYTFKDAGFNYQEATHYTLLLLIGNNSFSFAVTQQQKLMAWGKQCPLVELINPDQLEELLTADFERIITGVTATGFTLIPEAVYAANQVANIARYLDVQKKETVLAQQLDRDNRIVFKVTEGTSIAAADYGWPQVIYGASGFVNAIAGNEPSDEHLYLNISPGSFDLLRFVQGKLHLYNTFTYVNEDELVYFTLFAAEQLQLDRELTTIILNGDVSAGDGYFTHLGKFFAEIKLNNLQLLELPQGIEPHQVLALSALSLCASLAEA
jgi:hypothetical protein